MKAHLDMLSVELEGKRAQWVCLWFCVGVGVDDDGEWEGEETRS